MKSLKCYNKLVEKKVLKVLHKCLQSLKIGLDVLKIKF
jgi:hypothetical protein